MSHLLPYSEAYIHYLVHFHGSRDFFECHELLEEHWKEETDPELKPVWHGLIQVAVSAYHERRGNARGALKMLEQAYSRLMKADPSLAGLDRGKLMVLLEARLEGLRKGKAYSDPELPIADARLLEECLRLCASWGFEWNRASPLNEEPLLHRHTLRDRTEVIMERKRILADRHGREPSGKGGTEA